MRGTTLGLALLCTCSGPHDVADAGDDATTNDGGADVAPKDALVDVLDSGDGGIVYNDMTLSANWTTYSPTLDAKGIQGGTFDGRYIYLAPAFGSVVTRYDTTAPFATASSWSNFDVSVLPGSPKQFFGTAFDGTYVYFAPNASGLVIRYYTPKLFDVAASWATFDTTTVSSNAHSYNGATYDGRFVYFASSDGDTISYDVLSPFTTAGSWMSYTLLGNAGGSHYGALLDGQHVYYVPFSSANAVRYDATTLAFNLVSSWTTFDMGPVAASDAGVAYPFAGAAFDGRYAYFISDNDSRVVQYDTKSAFGSSGSWQAFDTAGVMTPNTQLLLGAFDGRYVYVGSHQGRIGRYDTLAPFSATSSWSMYPTTTGETGAMVFDGQSLYVVGTSVARFDAKSPRKMPAIAQFTGSFY